MIDSLRVRVFALWRLWRHPRTPRAVRWIAFAVLVYALSPIDLIPDFVPVLGLLDDALLIPLGIALAVRLTPPALWQECLLEAHAMTLAPRWRWAALGVAVVALVWIAVLALLGWGIITGLQ